MHSSGARVRVLEKCFDFLERRRNDRQLVGPLPVSEMIVDLFERAFEDDLGGASLRLDSSLALE